jgi:hypothetical protein
MAEYSVALQEIIGGAMGALARIGQLRDPEELSRLYDRHASTVYQLGLSAGLAREQSETLVEEVFYTVWKTAASYDGSVGELDWIVAVAAKALAPKPLASIPLSACEESSVAARLA